MDERTENWLPISCQAEAGWEERGWGMRREGDGEGAGNGESGGGGWG